MRTITQDGWPYEYRAHIIAEEWFGRPRWRYVIEQKWVHWRHYKMSRRFKTEAAAVDAANRWLDQKEMKWDKAFV